MIEILALLFGSLVTWFLYTKDARKSRYDAKVDMYRVLSEKLSRLLLLRSEKEKNKDKYNDEYSKLHIELTEYILINKFIISQQVNDLSLNFLTSNDEEIDIMMNNLNKTLDRMKVELGIDIIDKSNQLLRLEPLIQSIQSMINRNKKP